MGLAPWRVPLSRALHSHKSLPQARYYQLATVDSRGKPANRTVVFRGFLLDTNQLQMVTDSRSQKVDQINSHKWGEVCWYFPKTREQFRLSGELSLITSSSELQSVRTQLWQQLSDAARNQFSWPDPGYPRSQDQDFSLSPAPWDIPLPNFCLLLLNPDKVDHLQLKGKPQNRFIYARVTQVDWQIEEVNP